MFYGKEKRVIVLRDIHSNLFEEAILVMKEDAEGGEKSSKMCSEGSSGQKNDFILKEAEAIINNYVKENKSALACIAPASCKKPRGSAAKKKFDSSRFMKMVIINSAVIGSIAAVIFILSKIF
jgi:hypothetical protein